MAHELQRRPIMAAAFRRGELSYSMAWALARMDRPDPAVDQAVVEAVGAGRLTLAATELEEFVAAFQASMDLRCRAVDQSSREDRSSREAALEEPSRAERMAEALMDMVHTALEHGDRGRAASDDRYRVHPDRTVRDLPRRAAHTVGRGGEPLHVGRRTREWSAAQRRAIGVRDGGRRRFVGCDNRFYDIHHIRSWELGGPTDIDNGCCHCRRHHRMLHHVYQVRGEPNEEMRFYRPDGTYIGSTFPATDRQLLGARPRSSPEGA